MEVIILESAEKYKRLLASGEQTRKMKAGLVVLAPGEEIGEHSTQDKEEALIILSGQAEISCAPSPARAVPPNSLVYIPAQTKHNVKNIGSQILRYVFIVTPVR